MTGRFVITAFAGALLSVSSCVKVETDGRAVPANPIAFEVVKDHVRRSAAPSTKAVIEYGKNKTFISSAFFLPLGQSWDDSDAGNNPYRNSAEVYIDEAEISCVGANPDGTGGVWKDKDNIYYWPVTGGLTFFAYAPSDLKGNGISVSAANGVEYRGWKAREDKLSCDLMVAELAKDRIGNTAGQYFNYGVPMLFKHKLTEVRFVAGVERVENNVWIKELVIKNIYREADYVQGNSADGTWKNRKDVDTVRLFYRENGAVKLSTAETVLMPAAFPEMLMIPQNLSANTVANENGIVREEPIIEIKYYMDDLSEPLRTATLKFSDIRSYVWAMGTKVKYSFTFGETGLPIMFNPPVVDIWSTGGEFDITIGGDE